MKIAGMKSCLRWTWLLLLAAALPACGKKKEDVSKYLIFEQTPHLALSGTQSQILSVNLERIRQLSIYRSARDTILQEEERAKWWKQLNADLGIAPLEDIDRIVIGNHGKLDLEDPLGNAIVLLTGDFGDRKQVIDGFLKFTGERYLHNPPPYEKTVHEGRDIYETRAPSYRNTDKIVEYYFAFPSDRLIVFSRSRIHLTNTLDTIEGRGTGIQKTPEWQARLREHANLAAIFWAVGDMPGTVNDYLNEKVKTEPELQGLTGLGAAQRFYANLTVDRQYYFEAGFECADIEAANRLTKDLDPARRILPRVLEAFSQTGDPRIAIWQELFDRAFFKAELKTSKIILRMEKAEVESLVRRLIQAPSAPTPESIPAPFLPSKP